MFKSYEKIFMGEKLGQHFLVNKSAVQKIIAALELRSGDTIIEIGPGEGALTIPLVKACQASSIKCQVIAIEKDPRLAKNLSENFQFSNKNFQIITGDALKILNNQNWKLPASPRRRVEAGEIDNWKLVGNIPYYITGKLLRILGELENKPKLIILTIQREVAERLTAEPPRMNLLAAATQIWCKPSIIGRLKPKDFRPAPEVESAIVKLEPRIQNLESRIIKDYYRLIKVIFKQPRKTLLNNLSTGLNKPKEEVLKTLQNMGLKGTERPQNIGIGIIQRLSQKLFTF